MELVIQITQFIMSLSFLIILHELGHFIPAKLFKTKVEKFYLFFDWPFSLLKKKIGETEYGIGLLPLGGYVKIAGMIDESMDKDQLKEEPKDWEFRSKPTWQRLIIMIGGIAVNFMVGFAIYMMIAFVWGKNVFCCLFSLVGQWARFTRFGAIHGGWGALEPRLTSLGR